MSFLKSILCSGASLFVLPISIWSAPHFTVNSSTVALWTFGSHIGTTFPDLSTNALSLSGANNFALTTSPADSAAVFTGSASLANSYVSHSNTSLLTMAGTGKITYEVRVFLKAGESGAGNGGGWVIGTYDGVSLQLGSDGHFQAAGQKVRNGTGYWFNAVSSPGIIPLNRWVDLAVAFDQTNGQAYGYIDGTVVQLYSTGQTNPITDLFRVSTGSFFVGNNGTDLSYQFKGTMDEIRVSNDLALGAGLPLIVGTPPPVQLPPTSLSYTTNPATYRVGTAITNNSPTINGTTPITYSVTPALPAGLTLNTSTGVISGTPTAVSSASNYVIIASNTYGSTSISLNITVLSGLTYSTNPAQYVVGTAITPNTPTLSGTVTGYSVSPTLPAGLILNATTGILSGTPTAPVSNASYTITANTTSGPATATLIITVRVTPSTLSYSSPTALYIVRTPITPNTPTVTGSAPITYSVSPALPAGLTLNTSTGIISGTPTTPSAAANYVITASNPAGSTTATLTFVVSNPVGILAQHNRRTQGLSIPASSAVLFSRLNGKAGNVRMEIVDTKGRKLY